jgi:hypothetical protein
MNKRVERFEFELERLAVGLAQSVIKKHLGGGTSVEVPSSTVVLGAASATKKASRPGPKRERSHIAEDQAPELEWLEEGTDNTLAERVEAVMVPESPSERPPLKDAIAVAPSTLGLGAATPATAPPAVTDPTPARGRPGAWTRESIISELVAWMSRGRMVDAQFVRRHGPRGFATAAHRIFGRIDAALNVASIELSKLQPNGPVNP